MIQMSRMCEGASLAVKYPSPLRESPSPLGVRCDDVFWPQSRQRPGKSFAAFCL